MGIEVEKSSEKKNEVSSVASSAFRFSMGTLLSRITGMVREQATAYFFGTSPFIAAFLIATRFALLLRRLLGEGALLTGFIPKFEEKRLESEERAAHFFREIHASLSWLLIFLLVCLESGLFLLWKAQLFSLPNQEILLMMMMILPSLFFICLYALCSAFLQCKKRFFLPAVAPAVFNIAWALAVLWVHFSWNAYVILGLSLSTILAYALQWAVLVPSSMRFFGQFFAWTQLFRMSLQFSELKGLMRSVSLTALGLGASQINGFLDILFARFASLEGPAYLNYAMRIHQLPLALIGVAISSALLPALSRAFKEKDTAHFQGLMSFGLKRVFTLIVPCTFAIFALGLSSVVLIYYRGCFHEGSVLHTTICLWGFGLGLLPMTVALLLNQGFYSRQEYRIPTMAALYSVALNLLLNVFFITVLQQGPELVTLSTSLAALFNVWFLYRKLTPYTGPLFSRATIKFIVKVLTAGSAAALGALFLGRQLGVDLSWDVAFWQSVSFPAAITAQGLQFLTMFGLFASFFILSAYFLNLQEIFQLVWKRKRPTVAES
jgi:putative peptidoglycan lipid II flippase